MILLKRDLYTRMVGMAITPHVTKVALTKTLTWQGSCGMQNSLVVVAVLSKLMPLMILGQTSNFYSKYKLFCDGLCWQSLYWCNLCYLVPRISETTEIKIPKLMNLSPLQNTKNALVKKIDNQKLVNGQPSYHHNTL